MANANLTKIGVVNAVANEEAAKAAEAPAVNEPLAPNISERRVVGRREIPAPNGQVIVIENL